MSLEYLKMNARLILVYTLLLNLLISTCQSADANSTTNTNTITNNNSSRTEISSMEVERVTEAISLYTTTISPSMEVESEDFFMATESPDIENQNSKFKVMKNSESSSSLESEGSKSNSDSDFETPSTSSDSDSDLSSSNSDSEASESDNFEDINFRDKENNERQNNLVIYREPSSVFEELDNSVPGNELHDWKAPMKFRTEYPYYLSGCDDENRPIFISTWGKFDMRKIVNEGRETMEAFEKYTRQAGYNVIRSHKIRSTPEKPVHDASFIIDFNGMRLEQLSSIRVISFCLKLARDNRAIIDKYTHKVVIINANYIAETAINLARPVLGQVMSRVEVYGTNQNRWRPVLLRNFPSDQLPPEYGGTSKSFKPAAVFV